MTESDGNGVPDFMRPAVADEPPASARVVAEHTFLALNESKTQLWGDVELLGDGARTAIGREMANRGQEALLPILAPFRCNDWPWTTDPTKGTGPARLEDAVFGCPVSPERVS